MKNLDRIKDIGFELAGSWELEKDGVSYKAIDTELANQHWASPNALYAFVVEKSDDILYIGKTTRTPVQRFNGYKRPGRSQATNQKVNFKIMELLRGGIDISIYLFFGTDHLRWGEFSVNLAAGLEDQLIKVINPKLNGKTTESQAIELENQELSEAADATDGKSTA